MRSVFLMVFNLFDENTHLNIKLYFSRFCQPPQIFFYMVQSKVSNFFDRSYKVHKDYLQTNIDFLGFVSWLRNCAGKGAGQFFHSYEVSRATGFSGLHLTTNTFSALRFTLPWFCSESGLQFLRTPEEL